MFTKRHQTQNQQVVYGFSLSSIVLLSTGESFSFLSPFHMRMLGGKIRKVPEHKISTRYERANQYLLSNYVMKYLLFRFFQVLT